MFHFLPEIRANALLPPNRFIVHTFSLKNHGWRRQSSFFLHFPWLPSLSLSVTVLTLYFCLFISPFLSPPPLFVSESLYVCSYVFVCLCLPSLYLTLRLILSVCIYMYLTVSPYSLYLISSSSSSPSTPFRRLYYPMLTDAPEL